MEKISVINCPWEKRKKKKEKETDGYFDTKNIELCLMFSSFKACD